MLLKLRIDYCSGQSAGQPRRGRDFLPPFFFWRRCCCCLCLVLCVCVCMCLCLLRICARTLPCADVEQSSLFDLWPSLVLSTEVISFLSRSLDRYFCQYAYTTPVPRRQSSCGTNCYSHTCARDPSLRSRLVLRRPLVVQGEAHVKSPLQPQIRLPIIATLSIISTQ